MLLQTWSAVLTDSFQKIGSGVIAFLPKLILALVVFIVGWVIAAFLGKIVNQIIKVLKIDQALEAVGVGELVTRGGFNLDTGAFIGGLVKWFFIVVFLVTAVDVLGLSQINAFLSDVVLAYIPNVIAATIILVMAAIIAGAAEQIIVGSAKAASLPSSRFLGVIARWSIWIFAILAALYQLGVAGPFVQTLFMGVIGMLALAAGLAFGLGGKDAAARWLEKIQEDISHRG